VNLSAKDLTKLIVCRLHFSEVTANNIRKHGRTNPDQRYFLLVVSLCAHHGNTQHLVTARVSDKIIVRVINYIQCSSAVTQSVIVSESSDGQI